MCLSCTSRRQSWRTRQAASPLSGCARKRRDKHTPFFNFGKINRQRAKICADPLANSSPFLCLHIFCSFVTHISGDFCSCLSLAFRLFSNALNSSFATGACACYIYKWRVFLYNLLILFWGQNIVFFAFLSRLVFWYIFFAFEILTCACLWYKSARVRVYARKERYFH